MARATVRIRINQAEIARMNQPGGVVYDRVRIAAGRVRDEAKMIITAEGRINTGALRASVKSTRHRADGDGVTFRVGSDLPYAYWQHEGVQGPIFPRSARVLRFKPSGSNAFVFARSVSGFSGIHYLTRPLARVNLRTFLD